MNSTNQGRTANYQICITYRCNLHCRYCFQLFDWLPCDGIESDVTADDIIRSGELLKEAGIVVYKLRFSGGEPLLHPDLDTLARLSKEHWNPVGWFRTYTSGQKVELKKMKAGHLKVNTPQAKAEFHQPMLVSPQDVGMKQVQGFDRLCKFQKKCGAAFDAYGFSACTRAWSLGRLFGFPVHSDLPVLDGNPKLCEHCLHSVSEQDRLKVRKAVLAGEIVYPSKSFRDAIEKRKREGFPKLKRFMEK